MTTEVKDTDPLLLLWLAWCWTALWVAFYYKRRYPYRELQKELMALYYRRAARVEAALASQSSLAPTPTPLGRAFDGWVELLAGGNLKISGQEFSLTGQPFEVKARDPHHVVRAEISCPGQGTAHIASHGVLYRVQWDGSRWVIDTVDPESPAQLPA